MPQHIYSVCPGIVLPNKDGKFTYTLVINGNSLRQADKAYGEAAMAKAAMRKDVEALRQTNRL